MFGRLKGPRKNAARARADELGAISIGPRAGRVGAYSGGVGWGEICQAQR